MPRLGETDPQTHKVRELHSLQELPESFARVSPGPLGPVEKNDPASWKSKPITDPEYWSGRISEKVMRKVQDRPVTSMLIGFGIGALLGLTVRPNR